MLESYLLAQQNLRRIADPNDLEKYYDIYDISAVELRDAESFPEQGAEDRYSLRSLRNLFTRLYTTRKGILCCLLSLGANGEESDITRWGTAIEEMRKLVNTTATYTERLADILNEQDRKYDDQYGLTISLTLIGDIVPPSPSPKGAVAPGRDSRRAQLRRLNSLSQGIRALHAKMHVIREESDAVIEKTDSDSGLGSTLITQYESIGADLRGLLQEWEAGKSALASSLEKPSDRLSRPSSVVSPASPTFSLGGMTAVDGSPDNALKCLNGDEQLRLGPDNDMDDAEVFEAVALPRKRASMSREERIARMREERTKHAAAREKADASTHMLKELETVIKLRPRTGGKPSARITSI